MALAVEYGVRAQLTETSLGITHATQLNPSESYENTRGFSNWGFPILGFPA